MIHRASLSKALDKHKTLFTESNIRTEAELLNAVLELDNKSGTLLSNIHKLNTSIESGDISTESVGRLDEHLKESLDGLSEDILNIAACSTEGFYKESEFKDCGSSENKNPYLDYIIPKLEEMIASNPNSNRFMKVCKSKDPLEDIETKLQTIKNVIKEVSNGQLDLEYIMDVLKKAEIPIFEHEGKFMVGEVETFIDDYETVYVRDAINWFKNYSHIGKTGQYELREVLQPVFRSIESLKILHVSNPSLSNPEITANLKGIQLVSKLTLFVGMSLVDHRNYIEDFS